MTKNSGLQVRDGEIGKLLGEFPESQWLKDVVGSGYKDDLQSMKSFIYSQPSDEGRSKPPIFLVLDTNALKNFQADALFLANVSEFAKNNGSRQDAGPQCRLVLPGQSVFEFFKNSQTFNRNKAREYIKSFRNLSSFLGENGRTLSGQIGSVGGIAYDVLKDSIDTFIENYDSLAQVDSAPSAYSTLVSLFDSGASLPMVSRSHLAPVGLTRLNGSVPPGWEDYPDKGEQALGDFYLWADLLEGVRSELKEIGIHQIDPTDGGFRGAIVFVSDDVKSDWNLGASAMPFLKAECRSITGCDIFKLRFNDFKDAFYDVKSYFSG